MMGRIIVLLVLALIGFSCNNIKNNNQEEKEIVEKITKEEASHLLYKWTNAYLTGNVTPLHDILDKSWIYSGSPNGQTSDKAATIEEFSNADYKFQEIKYEGVDIQLYNDIAIIRGSEKMVIVGNSGKDTTIVKLRFTDVYEKKNGKIKAIATHSSPIEDK